LKQAALEQKKRVAILQDLSGPKIRLGRFVDNTVRLEAGANFTLTAEPIIGDQRIISVNTPELLFSLKAGDRILLGDGIVELKVLSKGTNTAYCQVVVGGLVGSNQGVTAPGVDIRITVPTSKDFEDLAFGMDYGVDMVAQSFVRGVKEINDLKEQICKRNCQTLVIAKIEKREAIANLDAIIEAADGIMVARGDMGLEIGLKRVPLVQKEIIRKVRAAGKFVITAT
jgi:pyruvate kinase